MDATKQNLDVFDKGIAQGIKNARNTLLDFGSELATTLVSIAIENYGKEDANLTGNLLNSMAGGIFINGKISRIIFGDVEPETHHYTYVGDGVFEEYRTGDTVYFVFQYNKPFRFQKVDGTGTGRDSAIEFLQSYSPKSRILEVVICAAAPYAEYLQNVRKLDVLTGSFSEARKVWDKAKKHIKIVKV